MSSLFNIFKTKTDDVNSTKRYYLNSIGDKGGGGKIFGKRLKVELKKMDWIYSSRRFDYNLAFISGKYQPGMINILRLDGLYFDTENTVGDNSKLNAPLKKAYYEFDKIIFQSEFSKKMYFTHFGKTEKTYRIIYNGVPKEFSSTGPMYKYPFDKTLICSSNWRAHKRLTAIIDGFRELKSQNIGLAILGENITIDSRENIIVLGRIPPHKLPFYLRGADAFVHLSWLDWCPNTVVEALACGLPVLCGHNGGTKELVKDSGIIMEFEETYDFNKIKLYKPPMPDPKLVARGMSELLEWKKTIHRPDLSIDHIAKQYIDFILE